MADCTPNYFIVGDIQGCYDGLMRLLDKAGFCERRDILVSVGDMVARGEDSLATLVFLHQLGSSFRAVLGNHDLHLLALSLSLQQAKRRDNLGPLLRSERLAELIDWLRRMPLAMLLNESTAVVHAGLYPQWSLKQLIQYSDEVSSHLCQPDISAFLSTMYGNQPAAWQPELLGTERHRFIINACTRMRFLHSNHTLDFSCKEHPSVAPSGLYPWFKVNNPQLKPHESIIFGHWASLLGETKHAQFIGLDRGFVWGGALCGYWFNSQSYVLVENT